VVAPCVTVRGLLQNLCDWQQKTWFGKSKGNEPHETASRALEQLIAAWSPLTEKEVEASFNSRSGLDLFAMRKALYLPPLSRNPQFAPVLTMRCNLDQDCSDLQLRVMLVSCRDGNSLYGIGFRLECGAGQHDFSHSQLLRDFRTGPYQQIGPLIECPEWLPETQPSFPLPATNSVTLLLAMLISLYGMEYSDYIDPLIVGIAAYQKEIMACVKPKG
jgi:hypothetical protein